MKLFSTVLALTLSFSSFAGIREDVSALGKLALGWNESISRGRNADQVFKTWLDKEVGGIEAERFVNKEINQMEYSDEIYYGFTSPRSAMQMGGFAEYVYGEQLENMDGPEARQAKAALANLKRGWSPLIQRLAQQGAKFGYTGFGPGYCGIQFIELIVVDEKAQKVYEVYLSAGGEC